MKTVQEIIPNFQVKQAVETGFSFDINVAVNKTAPIDAVNAFKEGSAIFVIAGDLGMAAQEFVKNEGKFKVLFWRSSNTSYGEFSVKHINLVISSFLKYLKKEQVTSMVFYKIME